ncbi:hypothetical protein CI610_02718 [invertebrate metagenome]|uniref:AlpA family phage regulatory protein n=1 Tax=invertebrate metagenome TaxID=1711999 RepID=A0A2H9T548_9ZZZZ
MKVPIPKQKLNCISDRPETGILCNTDRILRLPDVETICGIKRSTIRRQEINGTFPRRISIGKRSVG